MKVDSGFFYLVPALVTAKYYVISWFSVEEKVLFGIFKRGVVIDAFGKMKPNFNLQAGW
jgi:hypothetical protein